MRPLQSLLATRSPRWRKVWGLLFGLTVSLLAAVSDSAAQVTAPARPTQNYKNVVAGGVSYGFQNARDADFWGFSVEYSRMLGKRWFAAGSLNWDSETESFDDRPDKNIKTYTLVGTLSYGPTRWLSITSGLGKGFADTDNPESTMRFKSGDLSTGIAIGFTTSGLPQFVRGSIGFSGSYEYNIGQKETSVSFDVSFGWSF